ncbi:hypothetical protein [Trinickia sp.]|uniref:hypothetical protein n=1 Tax=Trinickia sp. TaxID=2571163 RepID=UPI003F81ACF4
MKIRILRWTLCVSAMSAALALTGAPSFAQQPTTDDSSPGMARTPGSEGAAGTAGASMTPPGTTASPAPEGASDSTAPRTHHKHKKHHHGRHHRSAMSASQPEASSATKP